MVTCPTCDAVNVEGSTTCTTCGNPLGAAGDWTDAGESLSRSATLARSLQTVAVAIMGVSLLAIGFGFARGLVTDAPTTLSRVERISVGVAEQTIPAYLLGLLLAMGLALAPWLIERDLPWVSLAKTPIVLTGSVVGAIIASFAAVMNVRANLVVQKPATWAFKWKLAAYLEQVLGLAVVIIILAAVGYGLASKRPRDFDEAILPDDAHGHEHDHAGHEHDHAGHEHDHAGHEHDHAGHDHAGHDHDHAGHDHDHEHDPGHQH